MALNIPLPGSFGEAFNKGAATGSDVMQRIVMNPYDMQAKQAAALKDQAEAQKSQMLANLIQSAFGGGGGQGGGAPGVAGSPNGANQRSMVGWLLNLGEFPSDKRAGETQAKAEQGKTELNQKKQQDVLDSAYVLKNAYGEIKRTKDILQSRPDLTGPVQGFLAQHNLSNDPDLGKVIANFGKIQAGLARSATARPGIGAINWAARVKASESNPYNMNMGKLDETMNDMREEYDTYRRQYKEATGQEMPSFEEFMGEKPQGNQGGQPAQPAQAPGQPPAQAAPQQGEAQPGMPSQADIVKYVNMLPPKMKVMAEDAIKRGADPVEVLKTAFNMLNPQANQRAQ